MVDFFIWLFRHFLGIFSRKYNFKVLSSFVSDFALAHIFYILLMEVYFKDFLSSMFQFFAIPTQQYSWLQLVAGEALNKWPRPYFELEFQGSAELKWILNATHACSTHALTRLDTVFSPPPSTTQCKNQGKCNGNVGLGPEPLCACASTLGCPLTPRMCWQGSPRSRRFRSLKGSGYWKVGELLL